MRSVPQGSELGPILWIIAYDEVLRCQLPPGAAMVCYADDTLVMVGGRGSHETLRIGKIATACAIHAVHGLGPRVSPAKSEAIWFYDKKRRQIPLSGLSINMAGEIIAVGSRMKYLGLVIDSQWTFEPHFDSLIPKVSAAANALHGLLPNIGRAGVAVYGLYEGVVQSRVISGAPVWEDDRGMSSMASHRNIRLLRIIRRYRTVSHASLTVLAALARRGSFGR